MKYLIAVIQPDRLTPVLDELERREVHLVTVSQVMGRGRQHGQTEVYRSHKEAGLLRKVKLEIFLNEDFVEAAIDAITQTARTGRIGDGKIAVVSLNDIVRIRTAERGPHAIG